MTRQAQVLGGRCRVRAAHARVLVASILVLALAGASGCGSRSVTRTLVPSPDTLGAVVVAEGGINLGTSLAWSAATGEIVFTGDDVALRAVHAASGATRVLEPGSADSILFDFRVARSGRYLYGTRGRFGGASVAYLVVRRDLVSGASTVIDANALDYRCGPSDSLIATWHASGGIDSTSIVRPFEGTIESIGPGSPLAFSPAGTKLLHRQQGFTGADGWLRRDLASGTEAPFAVAMPAGSRFIELAWTPRGVQVVVAGNAPHVISVLDAATGSSLATFTTRDTIFPGEIAWSSDGRRFACLTHLVEPNGPGTAFRMNTSLWIADLTSGATSRRFDAFDYSGPSLGSLRPSSIVLSPDDAWVAYPLGFGLRQMRAQLP